MTDQFSWSHLVRHIQVHLYIYFMCSNTGLKCDFGNCWSQEYYTIGQIIWKTIFEVLNLYEMNEKTTTNPFQRTPLSFLLLFCVSPDCKSLADFGDEIC